MDPQTVLSVAIGAGLTFGEFKEKPRVLIGKDTRRSGYMVENALTAGFISVGWDVLLVGPLPTPAVAMLTKSLRADLGVMISASHNPFDDNGLKVFNADGKKLTTAQEIEIAENALNGHQFLSSPSGMGKATRFDDAQGRYVEFVKNTFKKDMTLKGLKIVLDCAHGAAYKVAPEVFWELGADVITMNAQPDGFNINKNCGALHPEGLAERVLAEQADIGIALDGDADRLIVVNEKGITLDGDHILALLATYRKAEDRLPENKLITTVMSNMGLEQYLQNEGITMLRAPVGDRYVSELMEKEGAALGGEASGHIIFKECATTGDGLIAALQLLEVLVASGEPLSRIDHPYEAFPQLLNNYSFEKDPTAPDAPAQVYFKEIEEGLGNKGRLLIRRSGTEPLLRVMVEGETEALIQSTANNIEKYLKSENYIY